MNTHNPQGLTPDQFGGPDGFRPLTPEETAILTDAAGLNTPLVDNLRARLKPELYHFGACRWMLATNELLDMATTYRTAAPFPEVETDPERITVAEYNSFALLFNLLAAQNHADMRERGFWESRDMIEEACRQFGGDKLAMAARVAIDGQAIALIHSEASEWIEALRHGNPPDDKLPEFSGAEAEAADVIIRIMDIAAARGLRVGEAIGAKMMRNRSRERMHGKQF
jgi:NTP pyrophosphatase (non-canonical NTP hydrolase)